MSEPVWIREVVSIHDPALEWCRALYLATFPPEERVHDSFFDALLETRSAGDEPRTGQGKILVAVQDKTFLGFVNYRYSLDDEVAGREQHIGAIFYMAVEPQRRGLGVGTLLYRAVQQALIAESAFRGGSFGALLFEVERPELGSSPNESRMRERRIAFYERHGASVVRGIDYLQPPVSEGDDPLPLLLMCDPGTGAILTSAQACQLWYRTAFELDADAPLVQRALLPLLG